MIKEQNMTNEKKRSRKETAMRQCCINTIIDEIRRAHHDLDDTCPCQHVYFVRAVNKPFGYMFGYIDDMHDLLDDEHAIIACVDIEQTRPQIAALAEDIYNFLNKGE